MGRGTELLCPVHVYNSPHPLHAVTNLEALQTPHFQNIYAGFLMQATSIINSISSSFVEDGGMRLKTPSLLIMA